MGKEDNKKYFTEKINSDVSLSILKKLAQTKSTLTIWEKGLTFATEEFTLLSYNDKEQYLTLEKVGTLLEKALPSPFAGRSILFKINIGTNEQLSSTGTLEQDAYSTDYRLKITSNFYKSQQRKELRLESGHGNIIKFVCKDRIFIALDASGGGTCVPLERSEKEFFVKGEEILNSYLVINDKKFAIAKSQVLKIFESNIILDADSSIHIQGLKVAIRFSEIAEDVKDGLCAYIAEIFKKDDLFIR